jgi:hypothetical protein
MSEDPSPMLLYDANRTFNFTIQASDPNYQSIRSTIRQSELRYKGYFNATFAASDPSTLQIQSTPLPLQSW